MSQSETQLGLGDRNMADKPHVVTWYSNGAQTEVVYNLEVEMAQTHKGMDGKPRTNMIWVAQGSYSTLAKAKEAFESSDSMMRRARILTSAEQTWTSFK